MNALMKQTKAITDIYALWHLIIYAFHVKEQLLSKVKYLLGIR